ncbi:hypothetical protein G9F31_00995 [Acinetobacter sp. 187]|uniref:hypothetical protein n=1 Tax=Acinetobacter lanii TaxID=2715163 RepID=UPI001409F749|nr:hypothetical protein [Acinetobacter lanii]NHC02361.1 hypothetical protein [Acinetobacter lanii]
MPNKYNEAQISLRDYFAGLAMQAIIANPSLDTLAPSDVSSDAYNQADAMLAERTKAIPQESIDWSKAPEWAIAHAVDSDFTAAWFDVEPELVDGKWYVGKGGKRAQSAPNFNYQGAPENSLIMRGAE